MEMILPLLLLVIFFICIAMLIGEGLWSNAITLFNVIIAALLATNFFEPLADYLDKQEKSFGYVWDFLSLWGIFALSMMVLRAITDQLSKVKVRFRKQVELGGGIFFAAWIGWMMVCFTLMTLHTAPLAQNAVYGAFQKTPTDRMFMGLAPDRKWLAYMHTMTKYGSFAQSAPEGDPDAHVFDPRGDFIIRYGISRGNFENIADIRTPHGRDDGAK